jgi:CHAT domain-containing protein
LYQQLARQDDLDVANPRSAARQLYAAMIEPVAAELREQRVTSLLIAADRGLQAVPYAALHDGERYFGERYAFSLTPAVLFTSLAPPRPVSQRLLAAGASEFQGLAPLPLVTQELGGLTTSRPADQFLNQAFTPQVLLEQAADPRYDRVHVASHAEFLPGGPDQAKLHTGTGVMALSDFLRLRQRREQDPLDLFVLSACRTALGDSDTEMGFAGLALQAGARSAIGTLWYVDDVATSAYFLQLYRYLDNGMPKAEALQATRITMASGQLRLQGDEVLAADGTPLLVNLTGVQQRRISSGFSHPFFWAGIELIGSPW